MKSLRGRLVDAVIEGAKGGENLFLDSRPIPGYISTGSPELDALIGQPGIPIGRLTEIRGWSGSGKSMLCCHLIANVQEMGGHAVLIDTERSYTSSWAQDMGVNVEEVFDVVEELGIHSLETALNGVHTILEVIREDDEEPVLIIVDSLSALATDKELESDYDDVQPATHAKILSKAMRKLTEEVFRKKVALVFVSQLRKTLMVYGAPTTSLGGYAVGFHSALRVELRKLSLLRENGVPVGLEIKAEVIKNKLGGIPFTETVVKFYFDRGIDPIMSALELAVEYGLVQHNRGWYTLESGGKKFREAAWPDILTDELAAKINELAFPDVDGVKVSG